MLSRGSECLPSIDDTEKECLRLGNKLILELNLNIEPYHTVKDISVSNLVEIHCRLLNLDFEDFDPLSPIPWRAIDDIILSLRDRFGADEFHHLNNVLIAHREPVSLACLLQIYDTIFTFYLKRGKLRNYAHARDATILTNSHQTGTSSDPKRMLFDASTIKGSQNRVVTYQSTPRPSEDLPPVWVNVVVDDDTASPPRDTAKKNKGRLTSLNTKPIEYFQPEEASFVDNNSDILPITENPAIEGYNLRERDHHTKQSTNGSHQRNKQKEPVPGTSGQNKPYSGKSFQRNKNAEERSHFDKQDATTSTNQKPDNVRRSREDDLRKIDKENDAASSPPETPSNSSISEVNIDKCQQRDYFGNRIREKFPAYPCGVIHPECHFINKKHSNHVRRGCLGKCREDKGQLRNDHCQSQNERCKELLREIFQELLKKELLENNDTGDENDEETANE